MKFEQNRMTQTSFLKKKKLCTKLTVFNIYHFRHFDSGGGAHSPPPPKKNLASLPVCRHPNK